MKFIRYNSLYDPIRAACLLAGLTLSLAACNDLLEERPKSVAAEVFYNTPAEVEAAVNAIYSPLRESWAEYVAALECQSDWMYGRGSWAPLSEYQGLNDANITRVSVFWQKFYIGIRNANLVIANAPKGNSISQQDIDRFVAEARFLRALMYFQLVRNWGAVPLRTEANMTEKDLPKSPVADVYTLIESDLLDAETKLPDNPGAVGRPSRWAAKTLLADVYLGLERFQEAAGRAGEVTEAAKYKLVPVGSKADFQFRLFGPEVLTTPEEIFYFKYARLPDQGNYILWISNHPSTRLFKFGGAYAVHGDKTNPNYASWDSGDIRKQLWDNVNFGSGTNTLVSSKYVDSLAISQRGAGNDTPVYRYADLLLIQAEAETRAAGQVTERALNALNQVRRRAYGLNPEAASATDYTAAGLSTADLLALISKERGYEFLYEGKRWLELKRTGTLNDLIRIGKNKTVAEKHLLWPIPVSEMNYNKALDPAKDQNPGY